MSIEKITVFDLDGTLISVNSFTEVSRKFLLRLLKKKQGLCLLNILLLYIMRKSRIISHLYFKRYIMNRFEEHLSEEEKQNLVNEVTEKAIQQNVYEIFCRTSPILVSTASPYSIVSRIKFLDNIPNICSLDPRSDYPSSNNSAGGKIENLKIYYGSMPVEVIDFYTDSYDDAPMIAFAQNAYLCSAKGIQKVK